MALTKPQISILTGIITLVLGTLFNHAVGATPNRVGAFVVWSLIWLVSGVALSLLVGPRDGHARDRWIARKD
jgi:hypothetical protein